mmetsp:Transcript_34613/g.99723  ORF Transcript_34613/g.99723 Transcript_34613/m.99723 type:complete len:211 (-) Transcript_34613:1051-1683(-)
MGLEAMPSSTAKTSPVLPIWRWRGGFAARRSAASNTRPKRSLLAAMLRAMLPNVRPIDVEKSCANCKLTTGDDTMSSPPMRSSFQIRKHRSACMGVAAWLNAMLDNAIGAGMRQSLVAFESVAPSMRSRMRSRSGPSAKTEPAACPKTSKASASLSSNLSSMSRSCSGNSPTNCEMRSGNISPSTPGRASPSPLPPSVSRSLSILWNVSR